MLVLGVESSCDETGVALSDSAHGLLAHALYSQIAMHNASGGGGGGKAAPEPVATDFGLAAGIPVCRLAGVGRAHAADAGVRCRALPPAGRDARRCGGR